ncbi:MAG TPA: DEAD/DEAH box helicase [Candidatus Binatia bacterium]|nr:DEAD/DEAH box helicase [Candidatus Binatia bacterium]
MIVLHAGVSDGRLLLWGEMPVESPALAHQRSGQNRSDLLLYDARAAGLAAALVAARVEFTIDKRHTEVWTAWLPTVDDQPVASSLLIAELPQSRAHTIVAPWAVTALPLSAAQAVEILCACVGKQTLAPGVVVGNDLVFWATALRCAGALVARQQFLPGVTEDNDTYHACWRPIFTGPDADLLAKLAKAMPPVCRALTREAVAPPQTPALSVLSAFIGGIVDHLVRAPLALLPAPRTSGREHKKKPSAFDSVHDQWLHTLRSPDAGMKGDTAELAHLAAQVREWQHPIAISTATPFRLCFRLEEPEDDENGSENGQYERETWYVRYLLQAANDPSLLIQTKDAWNPKGSKATLLTRGGFNAREYLLSSLGQAAGICPRIEASLKTAAPGGYALDATGAYEFLTEKALALEQAGFGVLLPAWWTRKGTKLRLTARAEVKSPKMQGGSGLSLNAIVQFHWQVALGNEQLSLEELTALAKLKQPLVKVRGHWVQMSAEEIQAALDFWKQKATDQATVREVVRMALGAGKTPGGIAFTGVTATGWIADLMAQLDGRVAFEELAPPDGFQGMLRPYQVRGYSWLGFLRRWGLGACLADDMGLGKTIETLALIQREWAATGKQPVLLICPTSVVGNWRKEATRFTPDLPVMVHHGLTRTKSAAFKEEAQQQAMVISSYALLHRDFEILKQVPWSGVILDEAQNIKNPETKQAQAARALTADYRITLTGTPVENHVGDLWSIMEFLNPGFLGTQTDFKRTFFVPIQANRDPEAVGRLKRLTGPFILRRLKTDKTIIADLPEKLEMKVFCTLTKEQASLYAAVVRDAIPTLEEAEGIQRRGIILATLSKLKQVCNHPAQFLGDNSALLGRSGKLARLTEMLEEILAVGDRALVFSQFAEMGGLLRRHLQETFGREVLFLHGAVPKPQRDRMVERFQAEGSGPLIFLLSLKAGGTGLNLTRANRVFHFDRWWNPAVENQATDRAFRIGQTKDVQVHKFLCVGTLEEKIDELIERKKEVAEQVVGTGEGWLTELSTAELKELFALRKEAVAE